MVGGTQVMTSASVEEDKLLKRNTDCVYFLASPLTCKNGSECEYRHSDVARVNPRDCYYWLSGNCLNPKCAFRHLPLDGLVGAEVSTPMVPSAPPPHPAPYAMPKQGVACIFFQKGFCLKGHLCPFLHEPPNSINNKPTQNGPANPVPAPPKTSQPVQNKSIQEQKLSQQATIQKAAPVFARNGGNVAVDKRVALSFSTSVEEPPRYRSAPVVPPPVMSEPPSNKPNRGVPHAYHGLENDRIINGKGENEYSREPSPGFDVLVENEVEDSEYYRETDEKFVKARSQGYGVNHVNREYRDFDNYTEREGQYVWDESPQERRPYPRSNSPDHFDGQDLRHRMSKQHRDSGSDHGLRSSVGRDYADRMPRRDSYHQHPDHRPDHRQDRGTLSSRLQGRIKIPGRSLSPTNSHNPRTEREIDIERKHISRFRDRISDNDNKFAGPKRLSELKTAVRTEHRINDEQSLGKRKYPKMEDELSFDGPKPLSEILKRKRGVNNNNTNSNNDNNNDHISSVNTVDNNQKEKEEHKSVSVDFKPENKEDKQVDDNPSVNYGHTSVQVEKEEGLIDEDALPEEELEAYDDQVDGDYEYEPMDGEEGYQLDEGEYVDEEEGDEYGKNDVKGEGVS